MLGNNSCAAGSGMDILELGFSGSQVMVMAPGETLLLCVFFPSLHLVCWGKNFY